MTYEIAVVATVILLLVVSLYKEWFRPVMSFTIAIILLLVTKILSPTQALTGFSNENVAIIFFLLILSNVFRKTGSLNFILNRFLKPTLSSRGYIARMALMVGGLSGFVNNTPLVAIMLPNVYSWANKKGISPSKVLMPLSYAAIVGGMLTLIGTSTNLIINGMAIEQGFQGLNFFAFTKIGFVIMVVVCVYVIFFSQWILPNRKGALDEMAEHPREYFVETIIPNDSEHINKTIEEAKLRNLKGLFLVEIIRGEKIITPVLPNEILLPNDVLLFAGDTETIIDVAKNQKDIQLKELSHYDVLESTDIIEAVVAPNSELLKRTVKENNFRENYNASIIAINRNGEKLQGKIGHNELKAGDLLLLVAGKEFKHRAINNKNLYVLSTREELALKPHKSSIYIMLATVLALALAACNIVSLFLSLLVLISALVLFGLINIHDIRKSLDLQLIAILALAISLGVAIQNSGAATYIGHNVLTILPMHNGLLILFVLYLLTNVLTMFVTNAASAAIMFPIAIAVFQESGYTDPEPFLLLIAFAASADFVTPYGYQTNLMVYGPGGYKFSDYIRFGITPAILTMLITILGISYLYNIN